jgi:DNA-binding transcriptional ArsR family regulator
MVLESDGESSSACLEDELRNTQGAASLQNAMRNARRASNFLKALSHETRLTILYLLSERDRTVSELETLLSLRQPAVSQQLARLRLEGIVNTRRDGKAIYYSIAHDDTRKVVSLVYSVFFAGNDRS